MRHRRRRPEDEIQRVICGHLKVRAVKGVVWFSVPLGGVRSPVEAAIFKGLGVKAGVADMIFLHHATAYALELKAPGGRATEAQMAFVDAWNDAGGFACIAEGLDRALAVLEAWGILRGKAT